MSAAMLLQAWVDTIVTTAALVVAILLIRKVFARHFGPRLTYALWLVPALRLALPPLPFGDPVAAPIVAAAPTGDAMLWAIADGVAAAPAWSIADALPLIFAVWAVGALAVVVAAMRSHLRFRSAVLDDAVDLEPIGTIRLVMTDGVDGPVAFGLWRRVVAVPHDFFARYRIEERALAIDHELAHHRHGDLWANAAALLLLAAQWFNPMAWRAIRAFRFDQEAACDARVLTMADSAPRNIRTARYATAIAKAAVGSRLSLAAPMAVHDNLQERLTLLTRDDISKRRARIGKLLVGSAALAVMATTATLVPSGVASASSQSSDIIAPPPAPPAPPEPVEPPLPSSPPAAPDPANDGHRWIAITSHTRHADTGEAASATTITRETSRTVTSDRREDDGTAPTAREFGFRIPGTLSREDILATLKEQGVTGKRAEAIADKLETRGSGRFHVAISPVPPISVVPPAPPVSPIPPAAAAAKYGKALAVTDCGNGQKPTSMAIREDSNGQRSRRVVSFGCGGKGDAVAFQISAMQRSRERFAKGDAARHLSDDVRAKLVADLDRAIADLERKRH